MKTYNSPVTQIMECTASFMLMQDVSTGGGIKGIKQTDSDLDHPIEIF